MVCPDENEFFVTSNSLSSRPDACLTYLTSSKSCIRNSLSILHHAKFCIPIAETLKRIRQFPKAVCQLSAMHSQKIAKGKRLWSSEANDTPEAQTFIAWFQSQEVQNVLDVAFEKGYWNEHQN